MKAKLQSKILQKQLGCQRSSNIVMSTSHNILEPVIGPTLESVLLELEEIPPPITPNPDESMEKIMYRSGQRSVVDWIRTRIEEG